MTKNIPSICTSVQNRCLLGSVLSSKTQPGLFPRYDVIILVKDSWINCMGLILSTTNKTSHKARIDSNYRYLNRFAFINWSHWYVCHTPNAYGRLPQKILTAKHSKHTVIYLFCPLSGYLWTPASSFHQQIVCCGIFFQISKVGETDATPMDSGGGNNLKWIFIIIFIACDEN